jgi:DNA polymerase iota
LAQHIRQKLEYDLGYTATVGISTNKLLSKLVGNVHKPNSQTTLLPPYSPDEDETDSVTSFIDDHEVGKIPGIGFKMAQKIRTHLLQRPADFDAGLVYGGTKEDVHVRDVRKHPGMGPDVLEMILGGPGIPRGLGARVWDLLNGCDDTPVSQAREVPRQISIEDSYKRLDSMSEVIKILRVLAISLLKRIRMDLVEFDDGPAGDPAASNTISTQRWLAHPKTIRLSTRPRPPQNPDGSRNRSFARISKSASMPNYIFNLKVTIDVLADRLVRDTLIPLFRQLHPEKQGWNLSLVNLAATNMADAASDKGGVGRDIGKMFRQQDDVLRPFRVEDVSSEVHATQNVKSHPVQSTGMAESVVTIGLQSYKPKFAMSRTGSEDIPTPSQEDPGDTEDVWEDDDDSMDVDVYRCDECGAIMPLFAMGAHERWHAHD